MWKCSGTSIPRGTVLCVLYLMSSLWFRIKHFFLSGLLPWNAMPGKACGMTLSIVCKTREVRLVILYVVDFVETEVEFQPQHRIKRVNKDCSAFVNLSKFHVDKTVMTLFTNSTLSLYNIFCNLLERQSQKGQIYSFQNSEGQL